MALSWEARRPVGSDRCATIADGLAVRVAIQYAVDVLNDVADRMLLVSEREIAGGVAAFDRAGIRAEGAAGAGLAAIAQLDDVDGPIVLIVTGSLIDDELLAAAATSPARFPPEAGSSAPSAPTRDDSAAGDVSEDRAPRPPGRNRAAAAAVRDRAPQRRHPPGGDRRGAAAPLPLHRPGAFHRHLVPRHRRAPDRRRLPPDHRRLRRGGRPARCRLHRGDLRADRARPERDRSGHDVRGVLRRRAGGRRAARRRGAPDARSQPHLTARGGGRHRAPGDRLPRSRRGRDRARRRREPGAARAVRRCLPARP